MPAVSLLGFCRDFYCSAHQFPFRTSEQNVKRVLLGVGLCCGCIVVTVFSSCNIFNLSSAPCFPV